MFWKAIQIAECFSVFQILSGNEKLILIIHQPEIQRLKFFLIHLALLFRFIYVSLWNNIRSLKIFTRQSWAGLRGTRCTEHSLWSLSPNSFLSLDISLVLFFSTFIKPHKLNKMFLCEFQTPTQTLKPTRRWKMKNIWIIYFLVTQGFALSACYQLGSNIFTSTDNL